MKLQSLSTGAGFAKIELFGGAGSGKTFTATNLALGIREWFELKGPIAFFDTESGSTYVRSRIKKATGRDPVGLLSRSLDDLLEVGKACLGMTPPVSVLIAESMSHVWDDAKECYLAQVNAGRAKRNLPPRRQHEFQDWGPIKSKFAEWTNFFLNSKLHIITCAREQTIFGWQKMSDDPNAKLELVTEGVRPRTEREFGYEPSLVIQMLQIQMPPGPDGRRQLIHRGVILKDRFGVIDGHIADDPTFDFIKAHIELLSPGEHAQVDTKLKTEMGVDEEGDAAYAKERKLRTILSEEITGELTAKFPGTSEKMKRARAAFMWGIFGTRSSTAIEQMQTNKQKIGLAQLREILSDPDTWRMVLEKEAAEDDEIKPGELMVMGYHEEAEIPF